MKGRYLVSTGLRGGSAMTDRVAFRTTVSYWSAQWIRVCEENVFCQDNVPPEFLFQSQHLPGSNSHCSTSGTPKQRQLFLPVPGISSWPGRASSFIKNAGVNISNNSLSPPLSTSAKNLEAKGNGRISLSKLCAGSHREWNRGKLQPDL